MSKLPKFITRLIEKSVALTINICYDMSLDEKGFNYSKTSDMYKDGLYNYQKKVLEELKKVEDD